MSGSRNAEPLAAVVVKIGRLVERRLQRNLGPSGLNAGQFVVLSHIARAPGASRAGIARSVHVTPQAVGGLTAQLLAAGLIDRASGGPGGPVAFTITDDGVSALESAAPAAEVVSAELRGLLRSDVATLLDHVSRHVLSRMTHNTPAWAGPPPLHEDGAPRRNGTNPCQ